MKWVKRVSTTLLFTMFLIWKYLPCSNEVFPLVSPTLFLPLFLLLTTVMPQTRLVHMHACDRELDVVSKPFTFALRCLQMMQRVPHFSLHWWLLECSGISQPVLGCCGAVFLPSCPWIGEGPIGSSLCQCKLKPAAPRDPRGLAQRLLSKVLLGRAEGGLLLTTATGSVCNLAESLALSYSCWSQVSHSLIQISTLP